MLAALLTLHSLVPVDDPWFIDATPACIAACALGPEGAEDWILEVNGPGVALVDLNGDDWLDLVLTRSSSVANFRDGHAAQPPAVFLGREGGAFLPAGEEWRVSDDRWTWPTGLAAGDVDGDGWTDLVVCQVGPDRVLRNVEGGGFEALDALPASSGWSTSAAFLDADRDGHLDLYVCGYLVPELGEEFRRSAKWKGHPVMAGPEGLVAVHDRFYRGLGDGRFEEASVAAGLRPGRAGYALGVVTLDVDRDGWTDLYVANDSTANHLWRNRGDGTFEERGFQLGVSHDGAGREQAGMGLAVEDSAGWIFVTNFSGESNALYAPTKSGRSFRERSARRGLAGPSLGRLGWGTGFADFDLDGDLDLWVANGHVYPAADRAGTDTSYVQADQLFVRDGAAFVERELHAGPARVSRAGVQGDLDRDGDLDLVVCHVAGAARVLRNEAPRGAARWLTVRPTGPARHVLGVGARVEVEVGERTFVRELRTAGGYQAARPLEASFGLGAAPVDARATVRVRWGGAAATLPPTVLEGVALDRVLDVPAPRPEAPR